MICVFDPSGKLEQTIAFNCHRGRRSVIAGRVLFTGDAYASDSCRFNVVADDRLRAFLELERVTRNDGY